MDISMPIYTGYMGAFLIIVQTALAASVGGYRGRNRKPIGDADDEVLARRIRRHANMTEYAPIYIVVLALYELMMGQTTTVFWMALLFAIARVLHLIGFSSSAGSHLQDLSGNRRLFLLARMFGAGLTLILSLAIGILLILTLKAL
ncbi:MAG: MAPEG family protein [Gammaproteobacteria bacterium]|nr:MAPEG family protein [Gammaproteobacteria bacterium]